MAQAPTAGIEALVHCLSDQQQLRGTGAVRVGEAGAVYLVFGHPLHAVAGELVGPPAVQALGEYAASTPQCTVRWAAGVTAGRAHSLTPADAPLARLRRLAPPPADPMWGIVIRSICASLEATLHRHAAPFVTLVGSARPDPESVLEAIGAARAMTVRAVARETVAGILDEAEALVRERQAG